jgi:hypothetical protein
MLGYELDELVRLCVGISDGENANMLAATDGNTEAKLETVEGAKLKIGPDEKLFEG